MITHLIIQLGMFIYPWVTTQLWIIESTGSSQSPSLSPEAIVLSTVPSFSTSANFCLSTAKVYSNLKPGTRDLSGCTSTLKCNVCSLVMISYGDQAKVDWHGLFWNTFKNSTCVQKVTGCGITTDTAVGCLNASQLFFHMAISHCPLNFKTDIKIWHAGAANLSKTPVVFP